MSQKIIIITALFPPEPVVSARLAGDLAIKLNEKNIEVTVLCPEPSRPLNAGYTLCETVESTKIFEDLGIKISRIPSYTAPHSKLFKRLLESYSFGKHVCRHLANLEFTPDVVYVNSWPLIGQALIVRYLHKKAIPLVLQIMDIYPESLLNKSPRYISKGLSPILLKLDRWIAMHSTVLSVISENMRRVYVETRKIQDNKVVTVNLWQDESLFEPQPDRQEACKRYGVKESLFTFLYLGNIGPVAGIEFLIKSFHKAGLTSSQLLIIGDGSSKKSCVDLSAHLGNSNIHFISDHDVKNVPLLQSLAHVCLLPLISGAGISSIPSKLSAYMLSSKPVLATVDSQSDTAHAIRDAQCGWVGEPENEEWMIAKMHELSLLTHEQLAEIGMRGRTYGLLHFSKTSGLKSLSEIILHAAYKFN